MQGGGAKGHDDWGEGVWDALGESGIRGLRFARELVLEGMTGETDALKRADYQDALTALELVLRQVGAMR